METMRIELRRAFEPEEMVETPCTLCGLTFEVESIVANVLYPGGDYGVACPACVGFYGQRNPERFPSLEEYEEAKLRLPGPIFDSVEAVLELEREHLATALSVYAKNRIARMAR